MRAYRPTRLENILQSKTTHLKAFLFWYSFSNLFSVHITVSSGVGPKRASGATPPLSASARGASIRLGTKVTFRLSFINCSFITNIFSGSTSPRQWDCEYVKESWLRWLQELQSSSKGQFVIKIKFLQGSPNKFIFFNCETIQVDCDRTKLLIIVMSGPANFRDR